MFMSDIINQIELNTDKNPKDEIFDITQNGTSKYRDNSYIDNLVMPIIINTGDEATPIEFIVEESTSRKLVFTDPKIKDVKYFKDVSGKNKDIFKVLSVKESEEIINTTNTLDIFGDGSCVACYTFDGNADDLNRKYNLTIGKNKKGSPIFVDDGKFNKCIKLGQTTDLQLDDKDYEDTIVRTVTGWFYAEGSYANSNRYLFDPRGDDGADQYLIMNDTWTVKGCKVYVDKEEINDGDNHFEYGKWHFVVCIFDDDRSHLTIGDYCTTSDTRYPYSWGDKIDQVRIFNRPLTAQEIDKLYYNEKVNTVKYHVTIDKDYIIEQDKTTNTINTLDILNDNSCIACYTFDNSDLTDLSGNYNGNSIGNTTPIFDEGYYVKSLHKPENKQVSIEIPNYKWNETLPNRLTFSLWVKINKLDEDNEIIRADNGSCQVRILNRDGNYNPYFRLYDGSERNTRVNFNWKEEIGTDWGHYVVTWDKDLNGGKPRIFINNKEYSYVYNTACNSITKNSKMIIFYGRYTSPDIQIDQVRIFNRSLLEKEIAMLYKEQVSTISVNNKIIKINYIPTEENYGLDNSLNNLSTDTPQETNKIKLFTLTNTQLVPSGSNSKYMQLPTAIKVKNTSLPNVVEVETLTSTMPKEKTQDIILEDTSTGLKTSFEVIKKSNNYIIPTGSTITIEEYEDFIKYNNSKVGYKFYRESPKDNIITTNKIIDITDDIESIPTFMKNMDNIFRFKITNIGSATLINNNLIKANRMDNFLHDSSNNIFYFNFDDIITNNKLYFIKAKNDSISFTIDIVSPIIKDINYNLTFYV